MFQNWKWYFTFWFWYSRSIQTNSR